MSAFSIADAQKVRVGIELSVRFWPKADIQTCPARPRKRIYSRFWGDSRLILVEFRSTRILELLCPSWGEIRRREVFQGSVVYTVGVAIYVRSSRTVVICPWCQFDSVRINLDKREICRKRIVEHTRETRNVIKTCQNFGVACSTLYRS